MTAVLLTLHMLVTIALVISVLLQRSEGGALGIGDGPGGLMTGRAAATLLSRTTAVLGGLFFLLAISLTVVPNLHRGKVDSAIIGASEQAPATSAPATTEPAPEAQPATEPAASQTQPADASKDPDAAVKEPVQNSGN